MKLDTALDRIANACHDIANTYTDERYLEFLNSSLQRSFALLIAGGFPPMINEVVLHNGDSIPQNFLRTCGKFPFRITGTKIEFFDEDKEEIRLRYFGGPVPLTFDDEDMPYDHDAINEAIVKGAILLAINEDEYDVTADKTFTSELEQAIASAMGAKA